MSFQIRDPCEKVQICNTLRTIRKLADEEKEKVKDAQGNDFKQNSIWSNVRQAAGEMLAGRWSLAVTEVDQFAQCLQCFLS